MATDWCSHIGCALTWYVALVFVYKVSKGIWTSWLGHALGFGYKLQPTSDSYAVITGATDGIGLEYAKYFGSKGYNLLLISRSSDKLHTAKEQVIALAKKPIDVRIHQADFSRTDIYEAIGKMLATLPSIEVLVNNVGVSYEYAEYLGKIPNAAEILNNIVNVNIVSCTQMVNLVLPRMEKQRKGLILNLSSFTASYPSPLLSAYGASKTYVDFLSRALQIEYESKKIVIQSVLPAFVSTKMSKIRKASWMVPSPKSYVAAQMKTVGFETRTYGYWAHKLQGFVLDNIVPYFAGSEANSRITHKSLLGVRAKVYKKKGLKDKEE